MIFRASSGSRSASSSIEPLRSAKSTVTCLRSPSSAAFEVRIFSARCRGVYVSGATDRSAAVNVATACPHCRQKRAVPGSSAPQDAQASARRLPQPRQNRAWAGLSCWHRGHFMPGSDLYLSVAATWRT